MDTNNREGTAQVTVDLVLQWLLQRRQHLLSYGGVILKDSQLAEDIFQEICVLVVQKWQEFDSAESVMRWSLATTRNKAVDEVRRRERHAKVFSDELLEMLADQLVEDRVSDELQTWRHDSLKKCVLELTPRVRQLLYLRYAQGQKPAKIAEATGTKIQTIYKTMARSLDTLRVCLETERRLG